MFSLWVYIKNIYFVCERGTFFLVSPLALALLSYDFKDQRRQKLYTYLSQQLMLD